MTPMADRDEELAGGFVLPNLCTASAVLFLILISVLLALTLVLFASGLSSFDWPGLGRAALLILWNMLASAALLCTLRRRLAAWSVGSGAAICYAVIVGVCLITSLGYQSVFRHLWGGSASGVDMSVLARDLLISGMLGGAALRYFHLQGELLKQQRAELNARIQSLQARIRPHFLFNSMNIIASLIVLDPDQAERAVEDLSELFRASLRDSDVTVALEQELDICERYLRLEQLRLGDRLHLVRRIPPLPPGLRVPPLCVQPLLENAVYHGIQPCPEGGELLLSVSCEGDRLCIEVSNPVPAAQVTETGGSGIALGNIRARLAVIYGGAATLETRSEQGRFHARLQLPWVTTT